jgi:phospholipid/cholesterol/gamma-HCH transport system permease protein
MRPGAGPVTDRLVTGPGASEGHRVPHGFDVDGFDFGADELRVVWTKVVSALGILGDIFAMLVDAVWSTAAAIIRRRFYWAEFFEQAWFLISVTWLPTILIAISFGLVLVLEVGGLSVQLGATSIVGAVDAIGIVREAAPVITAIILSGAGGSAICSDLGARTMRDEISAMWVMAVDPVERLVAPRVLATVVVALLLNGIVAFAGILSGYLAAVFILHSSAGGFLNSFSSFAQPADAIESMFKAGLFGLLAAVGEVDGERDGVIGESAVPVPVMVTADGVSPVTDTVKPTVADVTRLEAWRTAGVERVEAAAALTIPPAVPAPRTTMTAAQVILLVFDPRIAFPRSSAPPFSGDGARGQRRPQGDGGVSDASTSAAICCDGGRPGMSTSSSGSRPSVMVLQRSAAISTNSGWGNTQ